MQSLQNSALGKALQHHDLREKRMVLTFQWDNTGIYVGLSDMIFFKIPIIAVLRRDLSSEKPDDRDAASLLIRLAQTRAGTQICSARVTCAVIKRPIGTRKHRI